MSENTIKCRKCGGPHFTIKCGKESKPNIFLNVNDNIENNQIENVNNTINNTNNNTRLKFDNKKYIKKTFTVKISELPNDITEREIMELTYDWGNIVKIKVLNYSENSVAYIDFKFEDQADYFIKALHKTKFEYLILNVIRVE
jgi:hypothetical protein